MRPVKSRDMIGAQSMLNLHLSYVLVFLPPRIPFRYFSPTDSMFCKILF